MAKHISVSCRRGKHLTKGDQFMHTTTNNPIARLLAPVGKLTLALLGVAAIGTAQADNYSWTAGSGVNLYYNTDDNWDLAGYPGTEDGAIFIAPAASKSVVFNAAYTPSWVWVATENTETPVTWSAEDPSYGMSATYNIGVADAAGQVGALVVDSGTYTAAGALNLGSGNGIFTMNGGTFNIGAISSWAYAADARLAVNIFGGVVNLNGVDGAAGLKMMPSTGIDAEVNVKGGSLNVFGDIIIGQNGSDATSTTTFNISDGGYVSCGNSATARWFKMGEAGTGNVNVNIGSNGVLDVWHVCHDSTGAAVLTLNGGTIKALGDIGYSFFDTDNAASFTVTLAAGGGIFDTGSFNISVAKEVGGVGGLVKKGTGTLTFSVMPTFTGTVTVLEGSGSVILPAGATIATGANTLSRDIGNGVEYYYFAGSSISASTFFTANADATITLDGETALDVDADVEIGKLTVTGSGTLVLLGTSAVTAASLEIDSGATVQLATGTTLANGRIVTTSVTGAGVIGYTGVNPDSSVGYTDSATWTGTVWVQGLTGLVDWNPAAFGNSESTLRLSGVAGHFANGQISLPFAIELENGIYAYGIDLTNGYSFNSNGGWGYVMVPTLKGSGTYKTSGGGGNLFVVTDDWSGFTGNFTLANKTVWLGYGTPTAEVDYTPGTVSGGIRIAAGKEVTVAPNEGWTYTTGFFGEGTVKLIYPWQATANTATSPLWTGTVELAACVNNGTASTCVYPDRMGNANSKIVFKGLAPGATKGYYLNGSTAATVQLDGPVTISDASSSARYEIGVLTGTNNFTGATSVGTACTFVFHAISNYTGTISANSKSLVTIGTYIGDTEVVVDQKLVGVDPNNANVSLNSVTVGGVEQTVATALKDGNDGYGLYVAALRRDVYWIGGASGNWSDTTAWALADGTPLNAVPSDYTRYAGDNVVFTNAAAVTLDAKAVVTMFTIDADVEFVSDGSGDKGMYFDVMDGSGKVTLNNVWVAIISESAGRNIVINNDICFADGSDNTFNGASLNNYIYGDISGAGNVTVKYKHPSTSDVNGTHFCGNNSAYSGTFRFTRDSGAYSRFWLDGGNASSANAVWTGLDCYAPSGNSYLGSTYLMTPGESYRFGGISGGVFYGSSDVTVEIGAREDFDSSFTFITHGSRPRGYITKVGSGSLTLNGYPYVLTLKGGRTLLGEGFAFNDYNGRSAYVAFAGDGATLVMSGYVADISSRIKDSTSAICFDDGGNDFAWATALAASNTGGLTKKGVGTLTLSVIPLYKGPTVVKEGKLVVPFGTKFESLVLEEDATVEVDMSTAVDNAIAFSSGKFTGNADNVILQDNAPAGYGGAENLGSSSNLIFGNGSVTYTWQGPTNDDYAWETASNWSPEGVPGMMDKVVFETVTPGFTLASDVTVMSLDANAQGFAYSANYALTVLGDMTVSVPGTLAITGTGSLEVNGDISGVNAIAMTPSPATQAIVAAHPYYTEKFRASNPLELVSLEGAGTISANDPQTVSIAQDATSTFYGSLTGGMSLTKEGEGTLELQGPNSFTGDIDIRDGSLKVSRYNYDGYVSYDFDASNSGGWTFADASAGTISKMTTSVGKKWTFASTGSAYAYLTNGFFGGATSVYFPATSQYQPDYSSRKNYRAYTIFTVYQCEDVSSTRYLHCYSTSQDFVGLSGGEWSAHCYNSYRNDLLYVDGQHNRTAIASKKSVVSLLSEYTASDNRNDALGINGNGGYIGAVGEIIGLDRVASIEQRAAIESYLMQKWGCDDAVNNQVLPKTAAVTMAPGTTLDMGGLTQTVKSFTGAGTVANGSLKTTGDLVATGNLTIQAVEGQTYTLSTGSGDMVTFTGAATGYFVQPQDGVDAASRFAVPNGLTVGFDRDGDFDVTIINAPAKWTLSAHVGAETTTYRIGNYPFRLYLR